MASEISEPLTESATENTGWRWAAEISAAQLDHENIPALLVAEIPVAFWAAEIPEAQLDHINFPALLGRRNFLGPFCRRNF